MHVQSQNAMASDAHPKPSSGKSFFVILKETVGDWVSDNAMRLSAALSLYTILSLAPLLVVTLKMVSVIWRNKESARQTMEAQLANLMGGQAAGAAETMLHNGGKHGSGILATVISFVVLLFSATGVFIELQASMNTIWGVEPKPNQGIKNFIRSRLLSLGMVFGIAFLLLVSMFISTVLSTMTQHISGDARWFAIPLDVVVTLLVVTVLFGAIFKFLPDVKIAWKDVWVGAIMTAALFTVGKYGLALYFKYGTPTSAFGAAGSLAAVLLWVYYSAFILFFGAEFTKVWSRNHGKVVVPDENAVATGNKSHACPETPAAPAKTRPRREASPSRPSVPQNMPRPVAMTYMFVMSAIAGSIGASYFAGKRDGEINRH